MRRLRDLIKYWKLRLQQDIDSLKEMREMNLKMVGMDRGNESRFGDWILFLVLTCEADLRGFPLIINFYLPLHP